MKKMSAEERIAELKKTLEYHIDRYYNQDSPEISDYEYDMMMQELKNLEKKLPRPFTIVAYDLNYMKRINDTYGHAAGDAYLRRMAHLLMREEPVSRGLSFRIGGDEFVTLFEGEEEETVLRELEVFHMAGAQAEVNGEPVTFAYGVASYDPDLDKGSLHNTLSRADALMYRFKKAARGES